MTDILWNDEIGVDLWLRCLKEEIGVTFTCDDNLNAKVIQRAMYRIRRDLADERLNSITLHLNDDGKTFLMYKKPEDTLP